MYKLITILRLFYTSVTVFNILNFNQKFINGAILQNFKVIFSKFLLITHTYDWLINILHFKNSLDAIHFLNPLINFYVSDSSEIILYQ